MSLRFGGDVCYYCGSNDHTKQECSDAAALDHFRGERHQWNWRTDIDGVQWVCRGYHERGQGCEWELASAYLT